MKIGFDARLINESGVGRYIKNLLPILIKKNKRHFWVISVRNEERKIVEELLLPYKSQIKIVEINSRWHSFKEQLEVPRVFNKEKVDLLHVPYINVPIFYNKRLAVTIHDLTVLTHKTGKASTKAYLYYLLKRVGYRLSLKKALSADIIYTVSNTVKEEIIQLFPKIDSEKIIVTYNGYSHLDNKNTTRIEEFQKNFKNYFFYVGNCHPHKNLVFLVDALDKFFEKVPNFYMVFSGRNDYFMLKLKDYISSKKTNNNFIFIENPLDGEVYNLYKKSRLVILPSLKEGFGLQILEAMDLESLILLSNIPAFKEVGGNIPYYFQPDSIRSFLISLNKTLRLKPFQKSAIIKKYKAHLNKFSWETTAEEVLRNYDQKEIKNKKLTIGINSTYHQKR